jgi:hypothetical protein
MKFFLKAQSFDIQGNVNKAIEYYKLSIEKNEREEEAYSNLIVMLIEINFDYGKSSYLIANNIISEKDIPKLYNLLGSLLLESIEKFQNTNEFIFWKYYCDNFYNNFERKEIIKIIDQNEDILIPYFYLYINDLSEGIKSSNYKNKIIKLKESINEIGTNKNKYIKSLIDSAEFHRSSE